MNILDDALLLKVITKLPVSDAFRATAVCRKWRDLLRKVKSFRDSTISWDNKGNKNSRGDKNYVDHRNYIKYREY